MAKKNGIPKSRWKKQKGCGCYYCSGTTYSNWIKKKYKHLEL